MSLFGRGNWSVFGVDPLTHDKFRENLNVTLLMTKVSQLVASVASPSAADELRGAASRRGRPRSLGPSR